MPHLLQSNQQKTFQADSGSDGDLSHCDKNSANGSKVWGNSVLSANFDAPIDNEDEIDIRHVAQMNEL